MSADDVPYRPRLIDSVVADALGAFAAVMVVGPRAVGKTTTAARLAAQVDGLDVPDVASTYRADPDAALRRAQRPLLIDEWQEVPEVLPAVKRAVDRDRTPGQFLLTGNIRATTDLSTWAGTGRVVRVAMHPLTEREIAGNTSVRSPLSRLLHMGIDSAPARLPRLDIDDYIGRAFRGSFPELVVADRTSQQRRLWLDSYLDDLVSRDMASIDAVRDPQRLRRYLTASALNLAGQPSHASLIRDAGINAKTASAYDSALASLAVLDIVPAWASRRLKRLTRSGKRYLVDTALAAAAAGVVEHDVIHDGDLRGRWFDAFATMQLRAELAARSQRPALHHLRVEGGRHEVDLVIDAGRQRLFGVEFKAGAAPTREDARHLFWLRDELGANFAGGVVFHTGQAVVELGDQVVALPLSAMWAD
ncbi:MAG: ATP-binding protein [Dermatophilaceae bacterium]